MKKGAVFEGYVYSEVLLDVLLDLLGAADHAGSGPAELDEILADLFAVEHGVESGHLIDADLGSLNQLGDLVHCGKRKPASTLSLCYRFYVHNYERKVC